MSDDNSLKVKLLHAFYQNGEHDSCIKLGRELANDKQFVNAPERISLANAYHKLGQSDEAIREFESMDRPFTNFEHRYAYACYLAEVGNIATAKEKVNEVLSETEMMKGLERKTHRDAINKMRDLSRQLENAR